MNHLTCVLCREHVGGLQALVQSAMVLLTEVASETLSFNVITGRLEIYLPFRIHYVYLSFSPSVFLLPYFVPNKYFFVAFLTPIDSLVIFLLVSVRL